MKQDKTTQEEIDRDRIADETSSDSADPAASGDTGEEGAAPAEPEGPGVRVAALEEEKAALYDQLLRQRAEFENARKRMEREWEGKRQFAEAALVETLLPVLDAFERAEHSLKESGQEEFLKGYELIHRQLYDVMVRAGVSPVESVGQTFDPLIHHAVDRVETADHADQEIVEEMQRGYKLKDRLLRPALVKVAVHVGGATDAPSDARDGERDGERENDEKAG